jgi:CheY-specific phosphatase CheX
MNMFLVQSFVAAVVEALRSLGIKELGAGDAKKKESYEPFGSFTTTVKGAANQIRLTIALSYDAPCASAIAAAVIAKELKGTKMDVPTALAKFCADICKTQKKKLVDDSWIATFTDPVTSPPRQADVPDFAKQPFMSIPFRTEHGRLTMEIGMTKM